MDVFGVTDRALTYVEIDVDYCALVYGVAPCEASLTSSPPTGTRKCFNTLNTCQDPENFTNVPVTLRFAMPTDYLPLWIECLPSIKGVQFTPGTISLGENLGQRASVTIEFEDHTHGDTGPGFDKYLADRDYNPVLQGSFFGKFRARQPFLRGRPCRVIRGFLPDEEPSFTNSPSERPVAGVAMRGDLLTDQETRHYILESFDGPDLDGKFVLIAKDPLKLADGDRAQAPRLSSGFLVSAINNSVTSATLSPSGVGNSEYPASGYVNIGGSEICAFTRSGDVLTLTRAQLGTTAQSHNDQDRVQVVLRYESEDPADIIYDLLTNYADVPTDYCPLAEWQTETGTFLNRVYTVTIATPTGVDKLLSEVIEQAALAIWWDDEDQEIGLQVLRAISSGADEFSAENTLLKSLRPTEQPSKRLSQVWVYFAQIDPLKPLTDVENFRSVAPPSDEDYAAEANEGSAAIKKIYSRWIGVGGRAVAQRLQAIQLGRYRTAPRRFELDLLKRSVTKPVVAGGYNLAAWCFQDDTGAQIQVPAQVTRLASESDRWRLEMEEALFDAPAEDLNNRLVIIDANQNNINLRTLHDALYPEAESGQTVTLRIDAGVIVGSISTAVAALIIGTFAAGVDVVIQINGRIQGRGGAGGAAQNDEFASEGFPGLLGGPALYTRQAIDIEYGVDGEVWGGGGGGAGSRIEFPSGIRRANGGGGGAGQLPGTGGAQFDQGSSGQSATTEAGGAGFTIDGGTDKAGDGGDPGMPGEAALANGTPGGAAGSAIDGVSFVTVTSGSGDVRGPTIN